MIERIKTGTPREQVAASFSIHPKGTELTPKQETEGGSGSTRVELLDAPEGSVEAELLRKLPDAMYGKIENAINLKRDVLISFIWNSDNPTLVQEILERLSDPAITDDDAKELINELLVAVE